MSEIEILEKLAIEIISERGGITTRCSILAQRALNLIETHQRIVGAVQTIMEDKYARTARFKHIESTVGEVLDRALRVGATGSIDDFDSSDRGSNP